MNTTITAARQIQEDMEDIQARRYRSITFTEDGTVIIVGAETGMSASGVNLAAAEAAFRQRERA